MYITSTKIYVYKIVVDNGGAPCVYNNLLSLSICKPKIRSTCAINDWIIGFGAKSTIGERLIYIAKVTDKLENGKYYKNQEYFQRPDCIYRWNDVNKLYSRVEEKKYHINETHLLNDLGSSQNFPKAKTLISNRFRYWGNKGTDEYKIIYPRIKHLIENLTQGHRVNHPDALKKELWKLIQNQMKSPYIYNEPTEADCTKKCNMENQLLCIEW